MKMDTFTFVLILILLVVIVIILVINNILIWNNMKSVKSRRGNHSITLPIYLYIDEKQIEKGYDSIDPGRYQIEKGTETVRGSGSIKLPSGANFELEKTDTIEKKIATVSIFEKLDTYVSFLATLNKVFVNLENFSLEDNKLTEFEVLVNKLNTYPGLTLDEAQVSMQRTKLKDEIISEILSTTQDFNCLIDNIKFKVEQVVSADNTNYYRLTALHPASTQNFKFSLAVPLQNELLTSNGKLQFDQMLKEGGEHNFKIFGSAKVITRPEQKDAQIQIIPISII